MSESSSRDQTPAPDAALKKKSSGASNPRFASQAATAEDVLKSHTVGLVQLDDFRKRRAEALESSTPASGRSTPVEGVSTPGQAAKRKRKNAVKAKLSFGFGHDDDDADGNGEADTSAASTPRGGGDSTPAGPSEPPSDAEGDVKRKLGPNSSITFAPKARTKNALLKEAAQREQLRREFLALQDAVKATEFSLPFVFYDGADVPGGRCRVRKGEQVWLFLERARKVGAETGLGGLGGQGGDRSRREWARVSVDDLMLVRHEIIISHHYDFYYFMVNKTVGYDGRRLFGHSAERTAATPKSNSTSSGAAAEVDSATFNPLSRPDSSNKAKRKEEAAGLAADEEQLEGYADDPSATKVVDRRWYERNKHIFPASVWEEFDADKAYGKASRRDTEGNSFFFS